MGVKQPSFFRTLIRDNRASVATVVALGIASAIGTTLIVAQLGHLMAIANAAAPVGPSDILRTLGPVLLFIVASVAIDIAMQRVASKFIEATRSSLAQSVLGMPLADIERTGTSSLYAVLVHDVDTIGASLLAFAGVIVNVIQLIGLFTYLAFLSFKLFLWTACFIVPTAILTVPGKMTMSLSRTERTVFGQVIDGFRFLTDGAKELRLNSFRRRDFMKDELSPAIRQHRDASRRSHIIPSITWGVASASAYIMLGTALVFHHQFGVDKVEILTSYVMFAFSMIGPMQALASRLPQLVAAESSAATLRRLGLGVSANAALETSDNLKSDWRALTLLDAHHTYEKADGEPFVLGPIDLTFNPGQITFIVGGNGSGKSTLIKLITGLYAPAEGEVWFDGELITDERRQWYRDHFSAVFQDFFVTARMHGLSDIDEVAEEYVERLGLGDKVSFSDGEFSTTTLSQGQRKRLALVVAYLEDRPIYVFDEWAADQDPTFKRVFYMQLLPELKARGKCVIAITHDDRYFHLADQVVKLEGGRLATDTTDAFTSRLLGGSIPPKPRNKRS